MRYRLLIGLSAVSLLAFTLPLAAQLDVADMHAKLGTPMHRETFAIPSGFALIADYAADNQLCQLQVPAAMPSRGNIIINGDVQKQLMYDFLDQLVPSTLRGKELNRMLMMMGAISRSTIEYEHVILAEVAFANQHERNIITVSFANGSCPQPERH